MPRPALGLTLLLIACSPPAPPAPPPSPAAVSALPTTSAGPPSPASSTAAVPATAAEPTQATVAWQVELARGTEHGVRSVARVGDAIWATGWYGDPAGAQAERSTSLPFREGNFDPFLAAITGDGKIAWEQQLAGALGASIALSTDGEVLLAGEFVGELKGALVPRSPVLHAFVSKIGAASRRATWTSGPNTMDIEHAWKIAPAPDGGAYLASELHAVARRPGEPSSLGSEDVLVSRYDAAGKRLWRTVIGSARSDWPRGLAALPGGDVVVGGVFDAPYAYDSNASTRSTGFITRVGADGSVKWDKRFGGPGVSFVGGVAASAQGHVFLLGVTSGDVTLGARAYHTEGLHDLIVAELSDDGEVLWVKRLGSTRSALTDGRYHARSHLLLQGGGAEANYLPRFGNGFMPEGISVAPDGTIAVGGGFVDPATIGDQALGAAKAYTGFVASLRADGSARWISTACADVEDVLAQNDGVVVACTKTVMKLAGK
ncbi:MAG: hypothetical protein ABJE95_17865 [Byssovorax sp.]